MSDALTRQLEKLNDELDQRCEFREEDASSIFQDAVNITPKARKAFVAGKSFIGGGKVSSLSWTPDSSKIATVSQDGAIIVFDPKTKFMLHYIAHDGKAMDLAFDASGDMIAVGGLDNLCTIYQLSNNSEHGAGQNENPDLVLKDCEGYVGAIEWLSEDEVIVGSGDRTVRIWDVDSGELVKTFTGHDGDVSTLSIIPNNTNLFVTGSCKDGTCKLWDKRESRPCVLTYRPLRYPEMTGWEDRSITPVYQEVSSVKFMRNGQCFGAAYSGGEVGIYDVRMCYRQVMSIQCYEDQDIDNVFEGENDGYDWPENRNEYDDDVPKFQQWDEYKKRFVDNLGVTSLDFSDSGRLLVTGRGDGNIQVFDILAGGRSVWQDNPILDMDEQQKNTVSPCSKVLFSPDGRALATSWKADQIMMQLYA